MDIKITLENKQLYPAIVNLKQFSSGTDVLTFIMEDYMYNTTDLSKMDCYAVCDMVNQEIDEIKLEKQVVEGKLRLKWTVTGYTTQLDGHISYQIVFKNIENDKSVMWFSHMGIIFVNSSIDGDGYVAAKYPSILQQWEERMKTTDTKASNAVSQAQTSANTATQKAKEAAASATKAESEASNAENSANKSEQMKDYIEKLINYEGTNAIEKEVVEARGDKLTLGTRLDDVDKLLEEKSNSNHTHDDRYYIKTELNNKLNEKLDKTGDASNVTNTFTQAGTLENLTDGEKLSASLGKIMKAIAELISHIGNKSNPHGVTKSHVGLGNVTNDAQVKRSEMGKASGVATLGTDSKVPTTQLPSNALLELGETSSTAYAGNKGKATTDNVDAILAGTKVVPKAKDTEMFDGHTSQYYGKQTDVTAIKSQLNRNLIALTNSSYYSQTIVYRSGQVCYLRCAGYLAKDVPANSELTIGTASMMPSEYRPGTDLVFYITVINNGTIIEVRIYTDGRVTFVSPQKLTANTPINLHLSYMTGKSNL